MKFEGFRVDDEVMTPISMFERLIRESVKAEVIEIATREYFEHYQIMKLIEGLDKNGRPAEEKGKEE